MTDLSILNDKQILENLSKQKNPFLNDYLAFYSTWHGGIIKNPHLMLLPIDDHMVHRGDGVFEAMKAVKRSVYLMDEHLQRLFHSAEKIAIKSPIEFDNLKQLIIKMLKITNHDDVIIRIFLSRGPGNFTVNPYDSVGAQIYIIITKLKTPPVEKYQQGVKIGKSSFSIKDSWMAQVKSCNYLPNVMMKKEAVDKGLDFVFGLDDDGFVTEGPTENLVMINSNGNIVHPKYDFILKGTTMMRLCELAKDQGIETEMKTISLEELKSAREILMCGTSIDVMPVIKIEGHKIGEGKPGPIAMKLRDLIIRDIELGPRSSSY